MSKQTATCLLCGAPLARSGLKKHMGNRACKARQAENAVRGRGLEPLSEIYNEMRTALERHGIQHEVAPAKYVSAYERRHSLHGKGGGPGQWRASLANVLCVPPWVKVLVDVGAAERIGPDAMVGTAARLGREFQEALMTVRALGGQRAVEKYLNSEGFYDARRA